MASPISPPTERPIRELKSANHTDGLYWLLVSRESPLFQQNSPLKRGTKFSDLKVSNQESVAIGALHPAGLWFCEEIVPLRSSDVGGMPGERFVIWIFSSDWLAQSSTNAGITYSGESTAHPIFARDYFIRRDAWEAGQTIATLTALTALIGATITAPGTGYTYATGAVGTATLAAVCSGGAIIAWIVTKEGSAITSGAAITITGDGTGATATAVIQPATAVLVAQNKQELPADSNLSKEFVLVRRVYETLPGPLIPASDKDPLLGRIQIYTQAVAYSGQRSEQTATGDITYQAREGSSVVALKIERRWGTGSGADADNPLFPVVPGPMLEDERGPVHSWSQLTRATFKVTSVAHISGADGSGGANGTQAVTGTTGTGTRFETNVFVALGEITSVTAVPTVAGNYTVRPTDISREPVVGGGLVGAALSLTMDVLQEGSLDVVGSQVVDIRYEPYNEFLMKKIVTVWPVTGPEQEADPYEDDRGPVKVKTMLVQDTNPTVTKPVISGGIATKITYERFSKVQLRKVTETWAVPGLEFLGARRTDDGPATIARQLLPDGETASSSYLVLSENIQPKGDGTSMSEKVEVEEFTPRYGQNYDRSLDVPLQFVKQKNAMATNYGVNRIDSEIDDWTRNDDTIWDIANITAQLAASPIISHKTIARINFYPTLTAVTVTYNPSSGDSTDDHPASQQGAEYFGSGSVSCSPSASSQSSASILPSIHPEITPNEFEGVPATEVKFWVPKNSSRATVLAALATIMGAAVSDRPQFHPKIFRFTLFGGQASIAARASSQTSAGGSETSGHRSFEWGNGKSVSTGVSVAIEQTPPVLCAGITITGATSDVEIEAFADASTNAITGSNEVAAITNTKTANATVEASVSPTSLSATTPTGIPTSGLIAWELEPGPLLFGNQLYVADVVNAASFAA